MTDKSQDVEYSQVELPPDSQLYPLLMANDENAWSFFNKHYFLKLGNYFKNKQVATKEDQEDLAQDTLTEFTIGLFNGSYTLTKGNLAQWLFGIASNILLRHQKKYAEDYSNQSELRDDHLPPEEEAMSERFSQTIEDALNQLSPKLREVVLIRTKRSDTITWQDIANELGISESAVKMRYKRGLFKLKEILDN